MVLAFLSKAVALIHTQPPPPPPAALPNAASAVPWLLPQVLITLSLCTSAWPQMVYLQVFSTPQTALQRSLATSRDIFGCHNSGSVSVRAIQTREARGAAGHPRGPRHSLSNNYAAQNISSTKAEKPCCETRKASCLQGHDTSIRGTRNPCKTNIRIRK